VTCAPRLGGELDAMRDRETIDAELTLVATLRRAAREQGGPMPSIDVADALPDENSSKPLVSECLGD
jgi:hypothetical protein